MDVSVETIKSDQEILVRCSLCGAILDRVSFCDWLKDQAFARTTYRIAARHQASCAGDKTDFKPSSSGDLKSINGNGRHFGR